MAAGRGFGEGQEEVLGPPHAHIRLERQAAQSLEHASPTPAAELVPDEIDRQGHYRDRADDEPQTDTPVGREGADHQEGRDRRQRNPDLLGHDEGR